MKRPEQPKAEGTTPLGVLDPKAFAEWPALRDFFFSACYEDGAAREPGQIVLRPEVTRWSIILKEPSSCQQMMVAAPALDELWLTVEMMLSDIRAPWTCDQWAQARRRKKG